MAETNSCDIQNSLSDEGLDHDINLPLPMHSSNQLDAEWLDFGHGGGGIDTSQPASSDSTASFVKRISSDEGETEPPSKKLHCDKFYDRDNTMNCDTNGLESDTSKKMVEFDILDEVEGGGMDENDNSNTDTDSDIPEEEIEAMLEEGLKNRRSDDNSNIDEDLAHEERQKVVLKAKGCDHFDILPEGWIEVTHHSGMPVYLHKSSRVCTMSKPYFLGPGSARKHEIPISAIPCLYYRKNIERENESNSLKNEEVENEKDVSSIPAAKVETVQDNKKERSLDYLSVRKYCENLFEFQTITVRRFKTWAGRRKHQKLMKQLQRPTLPEGTKLITCPLPVAPEKGTSTGNNTKREFVMNPSGKSYVCILHEYVQHAMRVQPRYTFKELENASTPYGAVVVINDMEYGTGYGSSKKQAKSEAAKATLEILIPQMKSVHKDYKSTDDPQQDVQFFDEVRVEDPRISDLCAKAGQPSPYQILLECLKRNYGMGDTQIKFDMQNLKHQKNEFRITVGKHTASVVCKNKRDGKQRASQAILQALHPHIVCWGSLLRLYGKGSCKTLKEKKEEEQQITELQSKACANKPNISILNKLQEEMLKLYERKNTVRPIGKFIPQEMELPSASTSNLNNVEF
ncbi:microprocessor complex subunit DGCR8 [Centruroides vittatus]|uniref:microprocessor complex subunit DGCR8 n=1 Tax=Centruroides vittatus TaxID=120091 RepID=UPI00350F1ED9